jgi:hypothetical protein
VERTIPTKLRNGFVAGTPGAASRGEPDARSSAVEDVRAADGSARVWTLWTAGDAARWRRHVRDGGWNLLRDLPV